jgi:Ala-tRNA(Pro) deacylase
MRMIPKHIVDYLGDFRVPHHLLEGLLVTEEVASTTPSLSRCVVQEVLLEADGEKCMAVLPAGERLDESAAKMGLGARELRILSQTDFAGLFPNCEPGAQPPFGRLYGLRVLVDSCLAAAESIVLPGGSHQSSIQMKYADYRRREKPAELDLCRRPQHQ